MVSLKPHYLPNQDAIALGVSASTHDFCGGTQAFSPYHPVQRRQEEETEESTVYGAGYPVFQGQEWVGGPSQGPFQTNGWSREG